MKILKSIVIALLFIVIAGGIAAGLFFGITRWFDIPLPGTEADSSSGEDENSDAPVLGVTDTGKKIYAGSTVELPESMTLFPTARDQTFTVCIPDVNSYLDYNFIYSCSFLSSLENDWWRDNQLYEEEYLFFDGVYDDYKYFYISLLQPFGAPVEVNIHSFDFAISFICRVDCLAPLEGVRPFIVDCDFGETVSAGVDLWDEYCGTQSLGTVFGEVKITKATIVLDESFIDYFKGFLEFDVTVTDYSVPQSLIAKSSAFSNGDRHGAELVLCLEYSMFIENFDSYDEDQQTAICQAWFSAYFNYRLQYNADFYVDMQSIYNGIVVESYTDVCMGWMISGYERGYVELPEPEYDEEDFSESEF